FAVNSFGRRNPLFPTVIEPPEFIFNLVLKPVVPRSKEAMALSSASPVKYQSPFTSPSASPANVSQKEVLVTALLSRVQPAEISKAGLAALLLATVMVRSVAPVQVIFT